MSTKKDLSLIDLEDMARDVKSYAVILGGLSIMINQDVLPEHLGNTLYTLEQRLEETADMIEAAFQNELETRRNSHAQQTA